MQEISEHRNSFEKSGEKFNESEAKDIDLFRILFVPNSCKCLSSTKKTHTSGTVALEITLLYPDIPILFMLSLNAQPLLDTSSLETNGVSEFTLEDCT